MRGLLEEWLSSAGYRVRVAASPAPQLPGAVDLTGVDLMIVSIYNPKHAGARQLHEIRAANPGTPLIALSCQFRGGLSSAGATAQSLGVVQMIAKPLTRDALLGAVHAMIGPPN